MKVITQPNFTCGYCHANMVFNPKEVKTKKQIVPEINWLRPGYLKKYEIETSYVVCPCCGTEHILKETKKYIGEYESN